jgi:peptidoglycan hydrolase CwlO-like protein
MNKTLNTLLIIVCIIIISATWCDLDISSDIIKENQESIISNQIKLYADIKLIQADIIILDTEIDNLDQEINQQDVFNSHRDQEVIESLNTLIKAYNQLILER